MPSKILAMMSSQKPSIITGNLKSEVASIMKESKGGEYFETKNINKVIDCVIHMKNNKLLKEEYGRNARAYVSKFNFSGEDQKKKVTELSGGERNRLALAKLMLQPFNVLVMDEPTNHLDIKSKNVLKEALNRFEGTLILVSHDRDFLQNLTDTVYEFKDQKIREYLGNIDYYLF